MSVIKFVFRMMKWNLSEHKKLLYAFWAIMELACIYFYISSSDDILHETPSLTSLWAGASGLETDILRLYYMLVVLFVVFMLASVVLLGAAVKKVIWLLYLKIPLRFIYFARSIPVHQWFGERKTWEAFGTLIYVSVFVEVFKILSNHWADIVGKKAASLS